jgi:hypothetical protein
MLLTHHQPFSVYEKPARTMNKKLAPVLEAAGGVKAWFWGHEHRFLLYGNNAGVEYGRLLGNGGVPVYMLHGDDGKYPAPAIFEDRRYIPKTLGLERWAYFGFAVLDFTGKRVDVAYFDETGAQSYSKTDTIL